MQLNALDLFSGIGGFALACERVGIRTVAFCEIDPFCRAVLAKNFPGIPVHDDIRTLDPAPFRGVDLVCGGFPCQDLSAAGKGAGIGGARSGLWFDMARIIAAVRPRWCLVENVSAARTRGADRVLADLEALGYDAWPLVVGAWSVGAPHRRERVWIVGHARHQDGPAVHLLKRRPQQAIPDAVGSSENLAETDTHGQRERRRARRDRDDTRPEPLQGDRGRWPARPGQPQHEWEEPRLVEFPMGGAAPGLPVGLVRARRRNNREALKAYGNAIVPDCAEAILRAMLAQEEP